MAYAGSGRLPMERASKLGHIKVIQEPRIQRLLEAFETIDGDEPEMLGELSGHIDLKDDGAIEYIVAVDGSHCAIPNLIKSHKRIAFLTAGTVILNRRQITAMKASPVVDPRDLARQMRENAHVISTVLPLAGIAIPDETVIDTIRRTVDDTLRMYGLYDILRFLVSREWLPSYEMQEHMGCFRCGREFVLPRSHLRFRCGSCKAFHTLSDYLGIAQGPPNDWAKEEAASSLRSIMETLMLLDFFRLFRGRPVLSKTLFVKDGPLLLRAQLARLVEPIRAYLAFLHEGGQPVYLVGVEKTGELVEHIPLIKPVLQEPGDFFLPSIRYLHERIQGVPFVEPYRNRVQYGSKVVVRLGPNHVVAFNVPTGEFLTAPGPTDLYGLAPAMSVLAEMVSHAYENALVPLVIANSAVSLSLSPSSDILEHFARRLLHD